MSDKSASLISCQFLFYHYKLSPHILCQHPILRNLRKNKDIVITKPDKGNGVVILDQKLYNNAVEEIFSDTLFLM